MSIKLTPAMDSTAPIRTEAGAQELRVRALGLQQKVRTVLLLVDGKRTVAEVRKLMQGAGVAPEHLQQLLDLGLIAMPTSASSPTPAPPPAAEAPKPGRPTLADILGGAPIDPPSTMTAINRAYEPYLDPAGRDVNNLGANTMSAVFGQIGLPNAEPLGVPSDSVKDADPALSAARSHLTQALNAMAPTDSAALMFRIGRCNSRTEMTDLLREVEVKLARRGRVNEAAEVVRHARALLMA
ncbi:MAG: hypothetical protein RL341_351 [Pseudomonadota bacterium]|jgi:hypothetical protein